MSIRGQQLGGSAAVGLPGYDPSLSAPKAVEQSQSEAVLYRIKSAIEYGHALAERLESLESRINGAKPQPVPTEGGALGYNHSLAGEMQRTADTAEYLTKRLEEVITSLERFA